MPGYALYIMCFLLWLAFGDPGLDDCACHVLRQTAPRPPAWDRHGRHLSYGISFPDDCGSRRRRYSAARPLGPVAPQLNRRRGPFLDATPNSDCDVRHVGNWLLRRMEHWMGVR
jgi:hypothetical protein